MLKVNIEDNQPIGSIKIGGTGEQILIDLINVITAIHEDFRLENPDLADAFRALLIESLQKEDVWAARTDMKDSRQCGGLQAVES